MSVSDDIDALFTALGDAQPAYCTPPTPGAPNALAQARIIGKMLGTPPMPWQELALRIITERRIDDPRRYRWSTVIITTPRQVGKTTLFRIEQTLKCILQPGRQAFYTAQTGKDARARWKDLVDGILDGPLAKSVKVRWSAGDSALEFSNRARIAPFAPTAESLHGYTPHDVTIDEAFAFDDAQGDDLLGAVGPAQITLPDRQLIIVSTAGNVDSTWLRRLVDQGRQLVGDPGSGVAYLEWSMPAGLDPWLPESWTWHPGLGNTITVEDLAELAERHRDSPQTWLRAYMNTWSTEADAAPILSTEQLEDATTKQTPPTGGLSQVAIAYEVAYDRSRSCILTAWHDPHTGRPSIRVAETFIGTDGLVDRLLALHASRPFALSADDGGPTRDITDRLRKAGIDVEPLSARDFATGCDALVARVETRTVSLPDDDGFRQSVRNAVTRPLGQSWALDRRKSRGPIPELVAAVVALRLLETAPAPLPKPRVYIP